MFIQWSGLLMHIIYCFFKYRTHKPKLVLDERMVVVVSFHKLMYATSVFELCVKRATQNVLKIIIFFSSILLITLSYNLIRIHFSSFLSELFILLDVAPFY